MQISLFTAEIKVLPVYTCRPCGRKQTGDTIRISVRGNFSHELQEFVDNHRATPHYMPVGWSHNGEFSCPACVAKSEVKS